MGKRLSKTTKQKIYQRFMSGETNITKLAKNFRLSRKVVYKILKEELQKHSYDFEETLKQIRLKEKKEKEKQQEERKAKAAEQRKIRSMFWELKTHVDDFWDHTEYKIADKLNICISEVFRALQNDVKYKKLKTLRNKNLEAAMNRLQLQNSISMSKSTRINTTQAVMLSLSVYKHDTAREKLIYSANVERPNDLPEALPVHQISHMHYLVQQLEEHEEEQAEEMEAQKQEA